MGTLFDIKNFNLYYGDHWVLKNINMSIQTGCVNALIGPSGCGKSSFLKSLNRMNDLVEDCKIEGEILFNKKNIYSDTCATWLRKQVGMVFQKPNPFPMSIYDNIVFGPKTHGVRNKDILSDIVEKVLRDVGLWSELKDRLKQSALALSGGQQQRLCIARTLAINPSVILMDEPTSALDPIATLKIEELIMQLKEKYSIIIVTHNMQQALRIADETAFFLLGEVVEIGTTKSIFQAPKDARTKEYISGTFG